MELEVGVRITRDRGDLTFASTETEAVFILAAHLPGHQNIFHLNLILLSCSFHFLSDTDISSI
ncbi:hypothetical protein KFK09_024599 [Dendrobium nobile]|uniref:Uncharacterized protein n=1 Tax=Dendrobium nobile TaxID=94219 RepID=A0A8T3AEG3_DENNO|nr:hypothetical protein KFK09_024599 [Dendrobium nobile]